VFSRSFLLLLLETAAEPGNAIRKGKRPNRKPTGLGQKVNWRGCPTGTKQRRRRRA
jgi:hypothetical protein